MSEQTTEAKILLTVEGRAAEAVARLKRSLEDAQKTIEKLSKFKNPLDTQRLFSKETTDAIEKYSRGMQAAQARARTWANAEYRSNRLSLDGWDKLNKRLGGYLLQMREAAKAGESLSKGQVKGLQETIARMTAVERVWARSSNQRESAERRVYDLQDRIMRVKMRAARDLAQESEREDKREKRRLDNLDRHYKRARKEALQHARDLANTPGRMINRAAQRGFMSSPAFMAAGVGGAATVAARSAIRDAVAVDTALIDARINGDMTKEEAKKLRTEATRKGIELGVDPATMIDSAKEAAKTGIPKEQMLNSAVLSTKIATLMGLNVKETTQDLGYLGTRVFGDPRFKDKPKEAFAEFERQANIAAALGGKSVATSQAMMSFARTGIETGGKFGLSPQASLAYGASAIGAGAEAQQAVHALKHQMDMIYLLPKTLRHMERPGHRLTEDERFLQDEAPRLLKYGSLEAIIAKFDKNPEEIFEFNKRLGAIPNKMTQAQIANAFFGAQFGQIYAGMGGKPHTMDEARRVANLESDKSEGHRFTDEKWDIHLEGWLHVIDVINASWKALQATIGDAFKPFADEFEHWFAGFADHLREGGFSKYVDSFLTGAIKGFGYNHLGDLLADAFGNGDGFVKHIQAAGDFGQGLAEGLKTTWEVVKGIFEGIARVLKVFGYDTSSAKAIGKLVGEIIGFSLALLALKPALSVFDFVKDGIGGLLAAVGLLDNVLKYFGFGGLKEVAGRIAGKPPASPTDAAPSEGLPKPGAPAGGATGWLRGLLRYLPAIAMPLTMDQSKEDKDRMMRQLGEWAKAQRDKEQSSSQDSPATIHRQSYNSPDGNPAGAYQKLLHNAAFNPLDEVVRNTARTATALDSGTRAQLASFGGLAGFGGLTAPDGAIAGGGAGGGGHAGMEVPGWYGSGSNRFGDGIGDGVTDPAMKGDVAARAKAAHDFFRSKGLSEEATAGILASMKVESNFTPNSRGDGGKAHGLFQHHADRRAQILAATGINMSTASFEKQLEGAWWEMNHGDAGARRALKILQTPGISAREAGGAFVKNFERPKLDERAKRGALAEGFARKFGGSANPTSALKPSPEALAGAGGSKPSAEGLADQMKPASGKPSRSQDGAGDGGNTTTIHAPVTIHAGNQSPQEIANLLQRHVSEARNFRAHDMEPELT